MITAKPIGGLGNQMFAYAAAYAVAKRTGQALSIDTSNFDYYKLWDYQLGELCVPQDLTRRTVRRTLIPGRLRRLFPMHPKDAALYNEPHFHYDDAIEKISGSVELNGYFQSWRYFADAQDDIVRLFQPAQPLSEVSLQYREMITNAACPVALHVRRGDFLNRNNLSIHGVLDLQYYRDAIAMIRLYFQDANFFLFSDDPEWVEKELLSQGNAVVIRGQQDRPWEDMHLMASCHHNIIANSSFSWWGAWLNQNPGKKVIAPRQWFSPSDLRTKNPCDLYPLGWILL